MLARFVRWSYSGACNVRGAYRDHIDKPRDVVQKVLKRFELRAVGEPRVLGQRLVIGGHR